MGRTFRPPPPKSKPRPGSVDSLFTATTASHTTSTNDAFQFQSTSLNEIDGDNSTLLGDSSIALGDNDDSTEISDQDSILAMAKRLDAASIISDPSCIEGGSYTTNNTPSSNRVGKRGVGGVGKGMGGLYARDQRDLDSIASEEESESSSSSSNSSSSDDSYEQIRGRSNNKNNNRNRRSKQKNRSMGQPHIGFQDSSGSNNYNQPRRKQQYQPPGSYDTGTSHNARHNSREQQQPVVPLGGGNDNYFSRKIGYDSNELQPTRGRKEGNSRGEGGRAAVEGSRGRRTSGERRPPSPIRSVSPVLNRAKHRLSREKQDVSNESSSQRRPLTKKMILIPIVLLVVIGIVIAIVIVVSGGGGDTNNNNDFDIQYQDITIPTTSPTYTGLYNCPPPNKVSGPTPLKGCVGYIICNANGQAEGDPIYCPSGTLYDSKNGVCNFENMVNCPTEPLSSNNGGVTTQSRPTSKPIVSFEIEEDGGEIVGPTTTNNLQLTFLGISSPGDVSLFEQQLTNYLNIFYSPMNINTLDEDDELRSVSEVTIDVTVKELERRVLLGSGMDDTLNNINNIRGSRRQQQHERQMQGGSFTAIYDQTTTYKTSNPNISIITIVSRPWSPDYTTKLITQLQEQDPDTFASLSGIQFRMSMNNNISAPSPTPPPTVFVRLDAPLIPMDDGTTPIDSLFTTKKPTARPVDAITEKPTSEDVEETKSPTTKNPTPSPTHPTISTFPAAITIQGLLWLDENEDGLYEIDDEPPMEGIFVNLRKCDGKDTYVSTKTTSSIGQYQFTGIDEGTYFVDFFKPSPSSNYDFTLPKVAGNDEKALDSDVIIQNDSKTGGKSDCMEVKEGFNTLTNAGYKLKKTSQPSSSPTTKAPSVPRFCAFVSGEAFEFVGCKFPCTSPQHTDCPDGMLCALTADC